MIEVVAGVTLLALLAVTILGAVSVVLGIQTRQLRTLACAELCNRLVLQYLDDPTAMPERSLPVQYGRELYRWELERVPVELAPAVEGLGERTLATRGGLEVNRLETIIVSVWLGEMSGGGYQPDLSTPAFTIARLIDPLADVQRNPTATNKLLGNEDRRRDFLNRFLTGEQGGLLRRGEQQQGTGGRR